MNTCIVQNDWKIRVIEERDELSCKLHDLLVFLDSDNSYNSYNGKILVGNKDMVLLQDQAYFMQRYLDILNHRIEKFS